VTFDVFGDFETRGYLRNIAGLKNLDQVRRLEHRAFLMKVGKALTDLSPRTPLTYADILRTHATLFGSVYPWAGQDRWETAPHANISRGGYDRMFAFPRDIRRAADHALRQGNDPAFMRRKPGEVLWSLAHAHPFLDGNGRTLMTVHTVLANRAGFSVAWHETDKTAFLAALTKEIHLPGDGYLDAYLAPFLREARPPREQIESLRILTTLGSAPALG
jgi:cell filamentation protein